MQNILVASNEEDVNAGIAAGFRSGYRIGRAGSTSQVLAMLEKQRYDVLFVDITLLDESETVQENKLALRPFWQTYPSLEIVVMAPQAKIRQAVMLVKAGARDYLTYPINPVEVKHISESIRDTLILQSELNYLRGQFWNIDSMELIQTQSSAMQKVFNQIRSVAPTKSTVLLVGETGTGKSVLAKIIHQHSNRRESQFIGLHCGSIADTLLESELFGHEKGAFTGAIRRKLGKFEIARGGTIFLDEIGTITPTAQIKLLQVLQDGTFQRVGGEETLEANARVIAATNTDLKQMGENGTFRKDLYFRLNVFPITIPPLRERLEDVPFICDSILRRLNKFESKNIRGFEDRVIESFKRYAWPGNIRELENLIERAYILETSSMLTASCFPADMMELEAGGGTFSPGSRLTLAEVRQRGIEDIERNYLRNVLARNKGRINQSAQEAGISTRQLNKLMNKHGLQKEDFRGPSLQI
jgi:DNA-binding NtrC family response regulator